MYKKMHKMLHYIELFVDDMRKKCIFVDKIGLYDEGFGEIV